MVYRTYCQGLKKPQVHFSKEFVSSIWNKTFGFCIVSFPLNFLKISKEPKKSHTIFRTQNGPELKEKFRFLEIDPNRKSIPNNSESFVSKAK